jgi:uncharacterized protein
MMALTMEEHRAALREGHLSVATCEACGRQQVIPADTCFACGSSNLSTSQHAGSGRVFSWVVNHFAFAPELESETPYTVVLVELDGGGRVYGRLEDAHRSNIRADMPVVLDAELTMKRGYPVYRRVEESKADGMR